MIHLRQRLRRGIEKTWPDLSRIAFGRAPGFVYGGKLNSLPVFTYHVVDERFEGDLEHLARNGYRTVGSEELDEPSPDGKRVALTFDDGDRSLTDVAVPALERHGFRAIAFVVAGLVPDRASGNLTGWHELREAVARGTLEVGAHSLWHHHVPVGTDVVGWVTRPEDARFEANVPVPRIHGGDDVALGTPILQGAPRYMARKAFIPEADAFSACTEAAAEPGFFERKDWMRTLEGKLQLDGRRESLDDADAAVVDDMQSCIRLVEQHCPNSGARELCYPWYAGDERTDRLAQQAGVRRVYLGVDRRSSPASGEAPAAIGRLPEEYLQRLPGEGRKPFLNWFAARGGQVLNFNTR